MNDAAAPLRSLIEAVYLKTISGELSWSFDQESDVCETSVGQGYIQVCSEVDEDGDFYYFLKLLNGQKQVIDTVYGGQLEAQPPRTGHKDYWQLLSDLRKVAHRRALGSDTVIRSMLAALDANVAVSPILFDDDNDPPF